MGSPLQFPGNHIEARAQEFIFSEAIAADARVVLLEAVYVCYMVHVSRQLAVPPNNSRVSQAESGPEENFSQQLSGWVLGT